MRAGSKRILGELDFELWIGDTTGIATKRERQQKTDRQDAQHILRLSSPRSAYSYDVLYPIRLPCLARIRGVRLLPVT
jgi:hypothetical protein